MAAELDEVEVDAFLADSVVVAENKIYAQGAGWDTIFSAAFPTRHPRLGVGVILRVPWTATNQVHELSVKLVDPDGNPLELAPAPPGVDVADGAVREVKGQFNAGRPPLLSPGDSQIVPVAINLDGLMFNEPNMYAVVVAVDGTDRKRLPLRVRLAQQLAGIGMMPSPGR
jgi:hypothetical protein